jgi:hypothetical protein
MKVPFACSPVHAIAPVLLLAALWCVCSNCIVDGPFFRIRRQCFAAPILAIG